jgi:hypothetical protein
VGPANRSLFYERYGGHLLELLSVVLSIGELMCVSIVGIRPCTALSCTVFGEAVLSLLGSNLQSGGEPALTRAMRTVTSQALARLLQTIITRAAL